MRKSGTTNAFTELIVLAHRARPEFTCRFEWRKDSAALWGNRCSQCCLINDYPGERRVMHRVAIEGDRPV